jgi:dTDP-4-amino-4,6-dideoxygalactose transaminase
VPAHSTSSYYFYWIQTEPEQRDALALFLREHDVYTTLRYYPLHLVERYGSRESLPKAEAAAHSTLCIPIHQTMTDGDVAQVVDAIASFFRKSVDWARAGSATPSRPSAAVGHRTALRNGRGHAGALVLGP